jgi:ABC-type nickel/cobalt efflux system permease component RcnA
MKRLAVVVAMGALIAALSLPAAASAHPLGNFTINRYAGLELSGNRLYFTYVLDLAEIPTFQDGQAGVGAPQYLARIERGLHVVVDGRPVRLAVIAHRLAYPIGQGGLHTTRLEAILAGPPLAHVASVRLDDRTYEGRIGWKEVVVDAAHGGSVSHSTAPATSQSDELRAYPKHLLRSPLDVTTAMATLVPGTTGGPAPTLSSQRSLQAPDRVADGGFTRLISRGRLSAGIVVLSLLIAVFWGAVHALTPGHGKSLVAGYLIGTRGRPRDAVLLGATVTVTHTAGVFGLGLVTLLLSHYIVPDALYPWLTLVAGIVVVVVGLSVFRSRLRSGRWHGHDHSHDHTHDHDHDHSHGHEQVHHEPGHRHRDPLTTRGILGVGVAAGILPCPSALVVLLSAIALHRVGFGIVLILAFSLGLAATVTGIGLVAVLARRLFNRVSFDGRLVQLLPAVSALVILCVGVAITVRAIPHVV